MLMNPGTTVEEGPTSEDDEDNNQKKRSRPNSDNVGTFLVRKPAKRAKHYRFEMVHIQNFVFYLVFLYIFIIHTTYYQVQPHPITKIITQEEKEDNKEVEEEKDNKEDNNVEEEEEEEEDNNKVGCTTYEDNGDLGCATYCISVITNETRVRAEMIRAACDLKKIITCQYH